jgi:hypothetical protein
VGEDWWRRLQTGGPSAIRSYFVDQAGVVGVVRVDPPPDVPGFIAEAMERDHGGFRDFADDEARVRALAAAFYLGSAFVESFESLAWAVGRRDVAEVGQPVVTGFATGADLPVLAVAENLLLDFSERAVETAVATWTGVASR